MKTLKQNRAASFAVILLVYVMAAALGVFTYRSFAVSWWAALLIADLAATLLVFLFSLFFKNASVYDPYWSVQPPVILFAFAIGQKLTALGILLLIAVTFWAIRLTANWAYTFKDLTHQDWRYTMLQDKTGIFYPIINLVGIHTVPTLVVYGCVLPAVYAVREGLSLNLASVFFISLSFLAALLQGSADIQMHRFKKHRDSAFIRHGLWKYSRHPNYLGEILMWWGVALSVVASDMSVWYLLIGAFSNTVLFFTVSIPMAEKRQSRKEGYAAYKNETRMLLPIKK